MSKCIMESWGSARVYLYVAILSVCAFVSSTDIVIGHPVALPHAYVLHVHVPRMRGEYTYFDWFLSNTSVPVPYFVEVCRGHTTSFGLTRMEWFLLSSIVISAPSTIVLSCMMHRALSLSCRFKVIILGSSGTRGYGNLFPLCSGDPCIGSIAQYFFRSVVLPQLGNPADFPTRPSW